MACHLFGTILTNHMNQCWFIVYWIFGTNFQENLYPNATVLYKKINLKMFKKWQPFGLGLNVLKQVGSVLHMLLTCIMVINPGGWFNIKMSSYQYRKSHYGDKMIIRPSYLHNGISYTGKMSSLYWIRAQGICSQYLTSEETIITLSFIHDELYWVTLGPM